MLHGTVGQAAHAVPAAVGARIRACEIVAALLLFAAFAVLFTRPARLFDADSYLHLALAREIADHGLREQLSWARFSTLGQRYGDKELLFHVLLVPFVTIFPAELGGKLALAMLCTALAWTLGRIGSHALGSRGWVVPVLVFGSGTFFVRALRLRPELLSLLFLVWVVWMLAQRRYLAAGLFAIGFALAHTAFHSVIVLGVLLVGWGLWAERRWEWRILAACAGGVAFGVAAHPQFPSNLEVFWVQNVELFRLRRTLAGGEELKPYSTLDLALLDAVFWIGIAGVWLARAATQPGELAARRMASFSWIAAGAFGVLFLQMGRFATLVIPFAALAMAFELRARGFAIGDHVALPGARVLSARAGLAVIAALCCLNAAATAVANWGLAGSFDRSLGIELDRLGTRLPDGARVAASWEDAELYAFHAPQARYLNVYDPVFMAVGDPRRHAIWSAVLAGRGPDLPAAISGGLESEYIAFALAGREELGNRLASDPRAELIHRGRHRLYRIRAAGLFATDWTFERGGVVAPRGAYVDARAGLAADGCATLVRTAAEAEVRLWEIAAWGPTVVWIGGEQRLQLPAAGHARIGRGAALRIRAEAGQRWTVRTCADEGQAGFYFLAR